MEQKELKEILRKHKMWLQGEKGGERANLRWADLRWADLQGADLQGANLRWADLKGANLREGNLRGTDLRWTDLRGADLDYSCWPLWCGSLGVIVDKQIAAQIAYHFFRLVCADLDVKAAQEAIKGLSNQFHRINECGRIE